MNLDDLLFLTRFFYWVGFLPTFPYLYFLHPLNKILFEYYFEKKNKKPLSMMKWVDKKNPCAQTYCWETVNYFHLKVCCQKNFRPQSKVIKAQIIVSTSHPNKLLLPKNIYDTSFVHRNRSIVGKLPLSSQQHPQVPRPQPWWRSKTIFQD